MYMKLYWCLVTPEIQFIGSLSRIYLLKLKNDAQEIDYLQWVKRLSL